MNLSLFISAKHTASKWVATIANSITLNPANVRNKMGYIEIFRIDQNGAGWVDLSEATEEEKLNLEIGLFQEGAL
jgi:hypothetical protein